MDIQSAWDFKLSAEQTHKIAMVGIEWAMVDTMIGHAIRNLSNINRPADAAELVYVLDISKKIEILVNRRKRGELGSVSDALVHELSYIGNNYRPDRNMIAHGIIAGDVDGAGLVFYSAAKIKALPLSKLDAILSEARYAGHVAIGIMFSSIGHPIVPLPPRPPERSALQESPAIR